MRKVSSKKHRMWQQHLLSKTDWKIGSNNCTFILQYVLYIPSIRRNLILLSLLGKKCYEEDSHQLCINMKKQECFFKGKKIDAMHRNLVKKKC